MWYATAMLRWHVVLSRLRQTIVARFIHAGGVQHPGSSPLCPSDNHENCVIKGHESRNSTTLAVGRPSTGASLAVQDWPASAV